MGPGILAGLIGAVAVYYFTRPDPSPVITTFRGGNSPIAHANVHLETNGVVNTSGPFTTSPTKKDPTLRTHSTTQHRIRQASRNIKRILVSSEQSLMSPAAYLPAIVAPQREQFIVPFHTMDRTLLHLELPGRNQRSASACQRLVQ
jgi:hypothetical protein